MNPEPPFLMIRYGKSFWVEEGALESCRATLQAFREGCFLDTWCYDASGGLWPIEEAKLRHGPSLPGSVLPWRRVPVDLRLGPRAQADLPQIVSRLVAVLSSDSEFCASLSGSAAELARRFQLARSPAEVIRIARDQTHERQEAAHPTGSRSGRDTR